MQPVIRLSGVQCALPMLEHSDLVRRLSADLHRASNALDTLLNALPIGIGVADDPECRHIRVNRAFADQLGIRIDQNASMSAPEGERPPFRLLIGGREAAPEDLPMQMAARLAREVGPIECDVERSDGRRVTLYEYASPLFDEQGRVRGALGIFVDITDRRRVEQENRFLAQASEILSASLDYEETLGALARLAVPVLGDYCAIDVLTEDRTASRVEVVIAGDENRDLAAALKRHPPSLVSGRPLSHVLRTGTPVMLPEINSADIEGWGESDEHRHLLRQLGLCAAIIAPFTARGRTVGLLTVGLLRNSRRYTDRDLEVAVDVARRAGLALDNALLYRSAQDANRVKEDFFATLSHELRTPLNALLGWTQLLKARADDPALIERAIDSIERNANAQAVLINDLLDMSRVMTGKLRLEVSPVDVQTVVFAAADAMRPAIKSREIELVLSVLPVAGLVLGDAQRLQQVVWNLLSNAVKFTPSGGRVDLSVRQTGNLVEISVADTGAGIEPAFVPHVFERFRQGDSTTTRAEGGLGIGLSIVRQLVELHGGSVSVESAGPGQGARFTVSLPVRDSLAENASAGDAEAVRAMQSPVAGARSVSAGEPAGPV
jgi:PAS domain S-box-containing protein